ncbi:MAG: flagellar hook-basal body complex protein FliE [Chitinivibrionales bacterium]
MNINQIGPIQEPNGPHRSDKVQKSGKDYPSFKNTLDGFLNDVNNMQAKAGESIEKLAAGEINDVHQVMNTVQEANVAFNMMMEIRNKVMEAYQEVMRMRL